jgi:glycosyltransferase involved in cell wall biosynthesis
MPAIRARACSGWEMRYSAWRTDAPSKRILWEQLSQPAALYRDRVDLIHAPAYVGPLAAGCPIVVTVHDLSFYRYPQLFPAGNRIYLQRMTALTMRRAARVIVDSESTGQDVQEILGVNPAKIAVVYPGASPAMQRVKDPCRIEALRRRYDLPERFVLCVGTLEPRKNIGFLLETWAAFAGRHALPHHLVIVGGKGWFYEELEARAQTLGLSGRVHFAGYAPDEDLPTWYSAADLFVYPSLYEGFGFPPLEAMACGTPVLTSDRSSLPEVVGEGGMSLAPDDPVEWANLIAQVLSSDETRTAMTTAGLVQAARFTWPATARETAAIYREVLRDAG